MYSVRSRHSGSSSKKLLIQWSDPLSTRRALQFHIQLLITHNPFLTSHWDGCHHNQVYHQDNQRHWLPCVCPKAAWDVVFFRVRWVHPSHFPIWQERICGLQGTFLGKKQARFWNTAVTTSRDHGVLDNRLQIDWMDWKMPHTSFVQGHPREEKTTCTPLILCKWMLEYAWHTALRWTTRNL